MATLRERDVFEYCENLFEKLKKESSFIVQTVTIIKKFWTTLNKQRKSEL